MPTWIFWWFFFLFPPHPSKKKRNQEVHYFGLRAASWATSTSVVDQDKDPQEPDEYQAKWDELLLVTPMCYDQAIPKHHQLRETSLLGLVQEAEHGQELCASDSGLKIQGGSRARQACWHISSSERPQRFILAHPFSRCYTCSGNRV